MRSTLSRILLITGAFFTVILCLSHFYLRNDLKVFPLDDAYIHFVYAKNLAQGAGFCFNPGETSLGTSSPLWVFVLALFVRLGFDMYSSTIIFSLSCYFLTVLLVFLICEEILESIYPDKKKAFFTRKICSLSAALLYLLSGNMMWQTLSGMETPLYHLISVGCLYAYIKTEYGITTALLSGVLLLCRITGLSLVLPVIAIDVLKNKKISPLVILTVFIPFPYYLYAKVASGSFLPVTAQGKLLTYVDGDLNFIRIATFFISIIKYLLFYEPAFLLLAVLTAIFFFSAITKNFRFDTIGIPLIFLWTATDVCLHGLFFRSLNHHVRYLAVIFVTLPLLGIFLLAWFTASGHYIKKILSYGALCLLIFLCLMRQPFWISTYHNNIQHVKQVYCACAEWVKDNAAANPIAAFDIGILKFITGRHVVDLGGVTNAEVHPFLKNHTAGTYLREKGVKLIIYSRFPDCDIWSGVYRSEYDRSGLLQEHLLKSFSSNYYPAPSITHSFQLDVSSIDSWIPATPEGLKEKFYARKDRWHDSVGKKPDEQLELSGYSLERIALPVVWKMAQSLSFIYYWKSLGHMNTLPFISTRFINTHTREVIMDTVHIPTHNLLDSSLWNIGEIIKERHVLWIPENAPTGTYEIWVRPAGNTPALKQNKSIGTFKKTLYEIAGIPVRNFPVSDRPEPGVMIGTFTVQPSVLKLLY